MIMMMVVMMVVVVMALATCTDACECTGGNRKESCCNNQQESRCLIKGRKSYPDLLIVRNLGVEGNVKEVGNKAQKAEPPCLRNIHKLGDQQAALKYHTQGSCHSP
mmetsp:Transcript_128876/g.181794  ORF Transcript_128876/g.181794 Transcript_128876/m.181794 type:complete len:106 (-) Transcript_128876:496-813(-)